MKGRIRYGDLIFTGVKILFYNGEILFSILKNAFKRRWFTMERFEDNKNMVESSVCKEKI